LGSAATLIISIIKRNKNKIKITIIILLKTCNINDDIE